VLAAPLLFPYPKLADVSNPTVGPADMPLDLSMMVSVGQVAVA
jgi:hypothetical protein